MTRDFCDGWGVCGGCFLRRGEYEETKRSEGFWIVCQGRGCFEDFGGAHGGDFLVLKEWLVRVVDVIFGVKGLFLNSIVFE